MTSDSIPARSAEFTIIRCRSCIESFVKSKHATVMPICKHFYRNQRSNDLSKEHAVESALSRAGNTRQTFLCNLTGKLITPADGSTFLLHERRFNRRNV